MVENPKKIIKRNSQPFPYIDIAAGIEHALQIKLHEGFSEMPFRTALAAMGYTPKSSSAERALSALLSYKLLASRGSGEKKIVWLTMLAKRILLSQEGDPARRAAIEEAVQNDKMLKKALEKWGESGLPSRNNVIMMLQIDEEFGFIERAAHRFATVLKDTFKFLGLKYIPSAEDHPPDKESKPDNLLGLFSFDTPTSSQSKIEPFALPLEGQRKITLYSSTDLTEDEFARLVQWIQMLKPGLLKKEGEKEDMTQD